MCIDMTLHCYIHLPSLGPALLLLAGEVPLLVGDVPLLVGDVPLLVGEVSFTRKQDKTNKTRRCKKAFFIIIVDGIRVTKP